MTSASAPMGQRAGPTLVSVVIPALNAAATIERQLVSLSVQLYDEDWEVIVADNGSTDGTVAAALRRTDAFRRLSIVDASVARSINVARNAGARAARGDLLLFVDADDVVAPGWLQAMTEAAPAFDVFGGSVEPMPISLERLSINQRLAGEPPTLGFLPYAWGGNLGVWRDTFESLGGFNERYAYGGTEIDFSWRAQLGGHRFGWVPGARVEYTERPTLRGTARQSYLWGRGNGQLYRDFQTHGFAQRAPRELMRSWADLALNTPALRIGAATRAWTQEMSWLLGRAAGTLRFRADAAANPLGRD